MTTGPNQSAGGDAELRWYSAGITHAGAMRRFNEDAFIERCDLGLWGVADGMGGHQAGDVASQTIVDALRQFDDHRPLAQRLDQIDDAMEAVNEQLLGLRDPAQENGIVGSTVAILVLGEHKLAVALWAGDSRIYRYRHQRLEQLSTDHSRVEEYVAQGLLDREDAASHPESNVVTRAVGSEGGEVLEADLYDVEPGDRFLLCSDGLTGYISDAELRTLLSRGTPTEACASLLDTALERDVSDNTTIVIVDVAAAT